jgi:hypothetical protein
MRIPFYSRVAPLIHNGCRAGDVYGFAAVIHRSETVFCRRNLPKPTDPHMAQSSANQLPAPPGQQSGRRIAHEEIEAVERGTMTRRGHYLKSLTYSQNDPYDAMQRVFFVGMAIWFVALVTRLTVLWLTRSYLHPDPGEVVAIAMSLATKGQFADAYGLNTGPTAHASPIYPLLLSVVFRIFGTGQAGAIAQEILGCTIGSTVWALMPLVSKVCRIDRAVGVSAGLGGALLPINRLPETKGASETALAGLMCVLIFVVYIRCWRNHAFSTKSALSLGAVGGLAILVSASLGAIVFGLLILVLSVSGRGLGRQRLLFPATVTLTIFIVLVPWALRNYSALGTPIWTRSNFGLELNVANNDQADPNWSDNGVAMARYHPRTNSSERNDLMARGEVNYNREKRNQALHWIATHPKEFLWLVLRRIFYFWFPKMERPVQTLALAGITLGSIFGLILLRRRDRSLAATFLVVLVSYPLVYYIAQAAPRYYYTVQWMLFFLTSYAIWSRISKPPGSTAGGAVA